MKRLRDEKNNQGLKKHTDVAEHKEEEDHFVFMARDKADNVKTFAWYIDLGASCHFINKRVWYISYVANGSSNGFVVFGGGKEYKGEGKVNLQITLLGKQLVFLNVHHVP